MSNPHRMSSAEAWAERISRYEELTFETGQMIEPAHERIDHGRVGTLKRREMFATLQATISSNDMGAWCIPNRALLSPRRICRIMDEVFGVPENDTYKVRGTIEPLLSDMIFKLMGDWRDEGFPPLTASSPLLSGRVAGWTVTLNQFNTNL